MGKKVTSSSQENTRKISKQLLTFRITPTRSRSHYYDVEKPSSASPLKKCGHTSQWFLRGVILLYDIFA